MQAAILLPRQTCRSRSEASSMLIYLVVERTTIPIQNDASDHPALLYDHEYTQTFANPSAVSTDWLQSQSSLDLLRANRSVLSKYEEFAHLLNSIEPDLGLSLQFVSQSIRSSLVVADRGVLWVRKEQGGRWCRFTHKKTPSFRIIAPRACSYKIIHRIKPTRLAWQYVIDCISLLTTVIASVLISCQYL